MMLHEDIEKLVDHGGHRSATGLLIRAPLRIGPYHDTPTHFYVMNDPTGRPSQAVLYNATNEHVFTAEETKEVIALLQAFIDEQLASDNLSSEG